MNLNFKIHNNFLFLYLISFSLLILSVFLAILVFDLRSEILHLSQLHANNVLEIKKLANKLHDSSIHLNSFVEASNAQQVKLNTELGVLKVACVVVLGIATFAACFLIFNAASTNDIAQVLTQVKEYKAVVSNASASIFQQMQVNEECTRSLQKIVTKAVQESSTTGLNKLD